MTDVATSMERPATTWETDCGGSGGTDPEQIVERAIEMLDRFFEEYLRVSEEDCF